MQALENLVTLRPSKFGTAAQTNNPNKQITPTQNTNPGSNEDLFSGSLIQLNQHQTRAFVA
jgi:hypothetical protein